MKKWRREKKVELIEAVKSYVKRDVIPNRAEGSVRNLLFADCPAHPKETTTDGAASS